MTKNNMNSQIIKILDYTNSSSVFWRTKWNTIKKEILKYYNIWVVVTLDFKDVFSLTHSFIDELIWAFFLYDHEDALEKIKFKNCSDDIKKIIEFVIIDRLSLGKKQID
jgi:hypothetical protein